MWIASSDSNYYNGKYESAGMKRSNASADSSLVPSQPKRQQQYDGPRATQPGSVQPPASPSVPHQCPEPDCGRRFNRKYTLVEHLKTHTGEKPHVCPVRTCSKRFSTSGNLSRHKRLHGFIQPIECPVEGCVCTFPSDNKLEKHMKYHLGSAVHVCQVGSCGKTFSTMGNLNRHTKNHHAEFVRARRGSVDNDSDNDEEHGGEDSEVDSDTFGSELQRRPISSSRPTAPAYRHHPPHNPSGNSADQLDVLASILHEEIDFVEPSAADAIVPTAGAAVAGNDKEKSDESELESPNRKRRRTILDDMISFHVAHFGD